MKRLIRSLFLAGVLMAALCVTALAADGPTEEGMRNLSVTGSNVSIVPAGANGGISADGSGFYAKADRLTVTVNGADASAQYLVLLQNSEGVPTEANIEYIDQDGGSDAVAFTVYPKQLVSGTTYHIYISSTNAQLAKVGSFEYYAPYKRGDANLDGNINVYDAMAILSHIAKNSELTGNSFLAAEVTGDGIINVYDAMRVLARIAGSIQEI